MSEEQPKFKGSSLAVQAALGRIAGKYNSHGGTGHGSEMAAHYERQADEAFQGIRPEEIAPIKARFGSRAVFEALASVGTELRVPRGGSPDLVLRAIEARCEHARLLRDASFRERVLRGDPEARDLELELVERANPRELDPKVLDAEKP